MSVSDIKYSIILPVYNGEKTIEQAIQSILIQEYQNWELIVVENGSNDHTNEIVKKFTVDKRIHLFHSDKGVSHARNLGLDMAKGEWVVFLDADDELPKDALDIYEGVINNNEIDMITGKYNCKKKISYKNFITNKIDFICKCLNNPTQDCNVTGVAFNLKLLNNNHIRFSKTLTHAEDSLFFLTYTNVCNNIMDISDVVYHVNYVQNSTVRRRNLNQFENYKLTINEMYKLDEINHQIKKELNAFVLNQVLIVLVNNIFSAQTVSFNEKIKYEKMVLNDEVVQEALNHVTFKYCDKKRKVLFNCMQNKQYVLLAIACSLKARINQRKGK